MRQELREELIQVAAVAVAAVEDLDNGEANAAKQVRPFDLTQVTAVLHEVAKERHRQDHKWGPQHHDPYDWLMILMEEVGEVAEEIPTGPGRSLGQIIQNVGRAAKNYLKKVGLN